MPVSPMAFQFGMTAHTTVLRTVATSCRGQRPALLHASHVQGMPVSSLTLHFGLTVGIFTVSAVSLCQGQRPALMSASHGHGMLGSIMTLSGLIAQILGLTATSLCKGQHSLFLYESNVQGTAVATTTLHFGLNAHIPMLAKTVSCLWQLLALLYADRTVRLAMMNVV